MLVDLREVDDASLGVDGRGRALSVSALLAHVLEQIIVVGVGHRLVLQHVGGHGELANGGQCVEVKGLGTVGPARRDREAEDAVRPVEVDARDVEVACAEESMVCGMRFFGLSVYVCFF